MRVELQTFDAMPLPFCSVLYWNDIHVEEIWMAGRRSRDTFLDSGLGLRGLLRAVCFVKKATGEGVLCLFSLLV
jgi:hypothetical protein